MAELEAVVLKCGYCKEDLGIGEISSLVCGHFMHTSCLEGWLQVIFYFFLKLGEGFY